MGSESMHMVTLHCLLGTCHGLIKLEEGYGIYYLKAYDRDPDVPTDYNKPEPVAREGGEAFVPETESTTIIVECTDDHYLEVECTAEENLDDEEFLYGPIAPERVIRCPECSYGFGHESEFQHDLPQYDRFHELKSVTPSRPESYKEVRELAQDHLVKADRIALRRTCPHCGALLSFNYNESS